MTDRIPQVLIGHKEIARFLGVSPRQVAWLDEKNRLPTFRIGRRSCARPDSLQAWLIAEEEKARRQRR
ncbi:hypothetical protein SAMN02745157_2522 [Kaistia soli DSM 19436]|uniref:Helix-turn-helix domain-containing protein n=1 Tax=Kaistia soli DSM 19436 TaxID=1122133 RepID=A0A1M5D0X3_9HYPH|nr:hypothetical protein SAMN02745157_2522 [Kaistia soli DSM 19436]